MIACFRSQDYPEDRCELLILDDAGQLLEMNQKNYILLSSAIRFQYLGTKYNTLADMAVCKSKPDILAVWEDDDIYLPHHLNLIAQNIGDRKWAKPSHIRSLYTGKVEIEKADGRFHASLAMSVEAYHKVDGWPMGPQLNFDQQLFTNLHIITGDGIYQTDDPSYIFRWASTGSYHGQALGIDW